MTPWGGVGGGFGDNRAPPLVPLILPADTPSRVPPGPSPDAPAPVHTAARPSTSTTGCDRALHRLCRSRWCAYHGSSEGSYPSFGALTGRPPPPQTSPRAGSDRSGSHAQRARAMKAAWARAEARGTERRCMHRLRPQRGPHPRSAAPA
eukprot:scaffold57191_cov64-Phaeocystis_antarctica.AAC.4